MESTPPLDVYQFVMGITHSRCTPKQRLAMSELTFRRSTRQEARQRVHFKNGRKGVESVWMLDLSPSGCQILLNYGRLKMGEAVIIQPNGLEGISGFVRWCKGDRAGIEFSPPLHPSVADHVAKAANIQNGTSRRGVFGTADTLGKRLLPPHSATLIRSVA